MNGQIPTTAPAQLPLRPRATDVDESVYAAAPVAQYQPDPAALQEMAWYRSYVELWGLMRPIRHSVVTGGWALWVLGAMVAAQLLWLVLR